MPIKLLHHKSWHVYSESNVERVRRDEAAEKLRVEAEEQLQRGITAQERVHVLRSRHTGRMAETSQAGATPTRVRPSRSVSCNEKISQGNDILGSWKDTPPDKFADGRGSRKGCSAAQDKSPSTEASLKEAQAISRPFKRVAREPWYTSMPGDQSSQKAPSKGNAAKEALDPLKQMKAHLARKKAAKQMSAMTKSRTNRDKPDVYPADRYNQLP